MKIIPLLFTVLHVSKRRLIRGEEVLTEERLDIVMTVTTGAEHGAYCREDGGQVDSNV